MKDDAPCLWCIGRCALVIALLASPSAFGQDKKAPRELLDLAAKAESSAALGYLKSAITGWTEIRDSAAEKRKLGELWIRLLAEKARTPEDVDLVLGDVSPAKVRRQLLFQRYLEQRLYNVPLPFVVVVDCSTGAAPALRGVFAVAG